MLASYWSFFGTLYLLILTYQDYKDKMMVDDRHNYFMMGLSISLYSHFFKTWWYSLGLALIILLIFVIFKKILANYIGSADITAIVWILLGFAIIKYIIAAYFLVFVLRGDIIFYIFYVIITNYLKINRQNKELPYFGFITINFIITCVLFNLY